MQGPGLHRCGDPGSRRLWRRRPAGAALAHRHGTTGTGQQTHGDVPSVRGIVSGTETGRLCRSASDASGSRRCARPSWTTSGSAPGSGPSRRRPAGGLGHRSAAPALPLSFRPFVLPAQERRSDPRADAGELRAGSSAPRSTPSTILFSAGIAAQGDPRLAAAGLSAGLSARVQGQEAQATCIYMAVIIPLWVSYLVRAYAWKIILGQEGILNGLLMSIGADPRTAHLPALQQVGGDPGADPHLHPVHPDADLRGAGVDPARRSRRPARISTPAGGRPSGTWCCRSRCPAWWRGAPSPSC